jgi:hypothetical protein
MLHVNGIECLSLHGRLNQKQRTEVLAEFRVGGPTTPRVLLMSSVGSVGLNMSFANVMIVVVSGIDANPVHGANCYTRMCCGRYWRISSLWAVSGDTHK